MKQRLLTIYYTFPIQLLKMQLKHNILFLGIWAFLFVVVRGGVGSSMGIHYLFLDPEYLGAVSFWSFFIIGLAYGSFFIAWNSSIYILIASAFLSWPPCIALLPNLASITVVYPFFLCCIISTESLSFSGTMNTPSNTLSVFIVPALF